MLSRKLVNISLSSSKLILKSPTMIKGKRLDADLKDSISKITSCNLQFGGQ